MDGLSSRHEQFTTYTEGQQIDVEITLNIVEGVHSSECCLVMLVK